jgi:predicted O-methyltransferase YrrM
MRFVDRVKEPARQLNRRLSEAGRSISYQRETLLQNMFYRSASDLGLELPPLYPLGGAANYGLLYLIMRIVSEDGGRSVLDIGAGQSSLLLDALRRKFPIDVTTLETDPDWAARVRGKVSHPVLQSPLEPGRVLGRMSECYADLSGLADLYDLIVVDAPMGTERNSRWATLDVVTRFHAPDCIVIFDDAERRGERDTIEAFMNSEAGAKFDGLYFARALKQQFVAFTPGFAHVRHYGWT